MRKGASTKLRIIQQSAKLMNVHGYVNTPISEIMKVTELKKGGLYNHFDGRDAIAGAAYEYAVGLAIDSMVAIEQADGSPQDRLAQLLQSYRNYADRFPLEGMCPILRGSVESANGPDWLQQRARSAVSQMIGVFERILTEAKGAGELQKGVKPQEAATAIVAAIEGAVMICGIQKSNTPALSTLDMVEVFISQCFLCK